MMDIGYFFSKLKEKNGLKELLKGESAAQFIRYASVGLLAAVVEYGLTIALTELSGVWYLLSGSAGYAAGFVISFTLNRVWSFKSKGRLTRQLALYASLFMINLIVSNALLYLLTTVAGLVYFISKLLVMGMVVLWNFVLYKKIIYTQ